VGIIGKREDIDHGRKRASKRFSKLVHFRGERKRDGYACSHNVTDVQWTCGEITETFFTRNIVAQTGKGQKAKLILDGARKTGLFVNEDGRGANRTSEK